MNLTHLRIDFSANNLTSIGAKKPLNGGPQHTQDHTIALKKNA